MWYPAIGGGASVTILGKERYGIVIEIEDNYDADGPDILLEMRQYEDFGNARGRVWVSAKHLDWERQQERLI